MSLNHLMGDREGFSLVDLSQISLATAIETYEKGTKFTIEEVRHMVLATLKVNVAKFKKEGFTNIVDNAKFGYWRRQFADYYKRNRAISREKKKDDFDFEGYFNALNIIVDEFKENMPYHVIDVKHAEADDCIGVLTPHLISLGYKVRIISSDGDFTQLHTHEDIDQYSPIQKKFVKVKTSSPQEDCLTKILKDCVASTKVKGDFYLSDIIERTPMTSTEFITEMVGKTDDELKIAFADDIRNTLLKPKGGKKWIYDELATYLGDDKAEEMKSLEREEAIDVLHKLRIGNHLKVFYGMEKSKVDAVVEKHDVEKLIPIMVKARFKRFEENRVLIDFNYIRQDIKDGILETFTNSKPVPKGKMYSYFVKNQLVKLLPEISQF